MNTVSKLACADPTVKESLHSLSVVFKRLPLSVQEEIEQVSITFAHVCSEN